ncbi:MAG TPA: tetratricopeptide repeat protein [Gemmatimonadales bacterium]|nr:tetratricopeptide repeat protein [Gemmatimonadales bacterium]
MSDSPPPSPAALLEAPFATLVARVAADPGDPGFVALAEAWRKRGDLATALRVVNAGLVWRPHSIPGRITQAWVLRDQGRLPEAEAAVREALGLDPDHPVARATLAEVRVEPAAPLEDVVSVPGDTPDDEPFDDPMIWPELSPEDELVTESLAALYRQQGHLEQAAAAYAALVEADPDNAELRGHLEAVRAQIVTQRPLPFSAEATGGRSVRAWLGGVALARPVPVPRAADGLEAFFAPPPAADPAPPAADLDAFQRWLQGLEPRS